MRIYNIKPRQDFDMGYVVQRLSNQFSGCGVKRKGRKVIQVKESKRVGAIVAYSRGRMSVTPDHPSFLSSLFGEVFDITGRGDSKRRAFAEEVYEFLKRELE